MFIFQVTQKYLGSCLEVTQEYLGSCLDVKQENYKISFFEKKVLNELYLDWDQKSLMLTMLYPWGVNIKLYPGITGDIFLVFFHAGQFY